MDDDIQAFEGFLAIMLIALIIFLTAALVTTL